ncbi:probable G-protein coupled receptor 160 [Mugil cephalus]|uniref:probable G-protein coupled receptor 160 n=1 Tax=Mugil cephalus TaxID=48193 RepID=UPI001FB8264A|nr:probable G-protein coupled receptor 160 [Mugil cephalus]XP_047465743.1 probable G-protein coupled receptor 160 [Mugil cephalus]XP_047465750.1 probable G-protein coupled receptor 160 [Mugil cephalus]XP_047465759.1 probable G-protein coupled receptor 160 [Mugil cephalus]
MLPESMFSSESDYSYKIFAIMEVWEKTHLCHTDNKHKYFLLLLFKLGLDLAVFRLCSRKWYAYFLGMCSFSIILVDLALTVLMATVWFLGAGGSFLSACFLLSNASVTYGALPLPMLALGLLDYTLQGTCRTWCRALRNAAMTLLMWFVAVTYSLLSVTAELRELEYETGKKALVCETQQSKLITYFVVIVSTAVVFAFFPFLASVPRWIREADRLCKSREEKEDKGSDLFFTGDSCKVTTSFEEDYQEPRPPLWFSLTLGFATFWMPFLFVSVTCLALGFEVPAYISVNLLWLECANSLLVGGLFWGQSKTQGPYNNLPENVCLWPVYWHLTNGTRNHPLPVAVSNPSNSSKEKKNLLSYV